jgi:hypothetical protein
MRSFTLSVVALGGAADRGLLGGLAESSGGRAFFPDDIRQVPTLVAREVSRVSGGRLVEEPFVLERSPHPILSGLTTNSWPRLDGYVVSAARASADTPLRSHLGDPILATWRAGLGRVGVYTADLASPWSAALRQWRDFDRLTAQIVRWVSRGAQDEALSLSVQPDDRGARIELDVAIPEGTAGLLDVQVHLSRPSGEVDELPVTGSKPGVFEARAADLDTGPYTLTVQVARRGGTFEARIVRGFYFSAERERQASGIDRDLLAAISRATGGAVLEPGDTVFAGTREPSYLSLRPWLAIVALVMFLLELFPAAFQSLRVSRRRGIEAASARPEEAA